MNNGIDLQPLLQNEKIIARPLLPADFHALYRAASDPQIWAQHPNPNRWRLEEFSNFFKGGIESKGALLVKDAITGEVIGSSRYTHHDPEEKTIQIGYTFFKRSHWSKGYNKALKTLMLNHIFQYVEEVQFYIGAVNQRSQHAITKIGAVKIAEEETAYFGEAPKLDFVYSIQKKAWRESQTASMRE